MCRSITQRYRHPHYVQALVVSRELIRVAILWHELWHEGLEEASRLFFSEKNAQGMIAVLEPLHAMLDAVSRYPLVLCSLKLTSV